MSPRQARDILISVGPNAEGKVNHIVTDNALDGSKCLGTVDTRQTDELALCKASVCRASWLPPPLRLPSLQPIPYAAPVAPQPAQADGSIIHVVRPGDTIWQIGIAYNVHPI